MKNLVFISLASIIILMGCTSSESVESRCIKGKYLGPYCSGWVIQILDGKVQGKAWTGMFDKRVYTNSFVASVDTIAIKGVSDPFNLSKDSVFFFNFKEGGYPRQEFNVCEPAPFITITTVYPEPCL